MANPKTGTPRLDSRGKPRQTQPRRPNPRSYFTKRYHPPGTPPGTLKSGKEISALPLTIRLIDFSRDEFLEEDLATPEQCRVYLDKPTTTWVDVEGDVPPDTLREIGSLFGLHQLALEDVLNVGQRPKIEDYDGQLFLVMSAPISHDEQSTSGQVSFFLGRNYLVSFHHNGSEAFESVRKRLRTGGRLRERNADYLLYTLLDITIDLGFPLLERYGEKIQEIEETLLAQPSRETLSEIHEIKRELLLLRRTLWPQREVINALLRDEHALILAETKLYLRDCYDHTVQIMDLIETYRDMTTSMLDVYLSSISNRLNDIMRLLTVTATIFIPLTFIVGVYGMNFSNPDSPWAMPELRWYYGYPLVWIIMIVLAGSMLAFFKRKRWL